MRIGVRLSDLVPSAPRIILGCGAVVVLAATTSAASAADLGTVVMRASSAQGGDVQVVTVPRATTTGGKFAGVPRVPPIPEAPAVAADGPLGIPGIPYAAYKAAEARMAIDEPGCGISWSLVAGIGYVESTHVRNGRVDAAGNALDPVFGPVLDGSGAGDGVVPDTDKGAIDGDAQYDRAVGPDQFLPSTWEKYGADGNNDGKVDPQNVFDATLGTARYLCSGGLNLRDAGNVSTAVYRYNHSGDYVAKVTMWARAYQTGVSPSSSASTPSTTSTTAGSQDTGSYSGGSSSSGSGYSSGSSSSGSSGYGSSGSSSSGYSSGSSSSGYSSSSSSSGSS